MSATAVVLANTVIDISFQVESFPILPEQHQTIAERVITPGGPANTLLCGARLGLGMVAMGNAGDDDLGRLWIDTVAEEGVDVSNVIRRADRSTSVTVVLTAPSGRHVFLGYNGGFNSGPTPLPSSWRLRIKTADVLFLDGWGFRSLGPEVNREAMRLARSSGVPVFFDPGPEIPFMTTEWLAEMFAGAAVALLTREEAERILGVSLAPEALAERILRMGPELVLLKLGAEGMIALSETDSCRHGGFRVAVRDLTGAGDSVAAAAMLGYLRGMALEELLLLANATGAAAVQKLGAGVNVPTRDDVIAVLSRYGLTVQF